MSVCVCVSMVSALLMLKTRLFRSVYCSSCARVHSLSLSFRPLPISAQRTRPSGHRDICVTISLKCFGTLPRALHVFCSASPSPALHMPTSPSADFLHAHAESSKRTNSFHLMSLSLASVAVVVAAAAAAIEFALSCFSQTNIKFYFYFGRSFISISCLSSCCEQLVSDNNKMAE